MSSLYSGTVLLDNYVEREDKASQTLYASGLYERETVSTTVGLVVTKTYYYQFGSQQTAMRQAGVVYWLHGDHLGSASLTTDGAGHKVAELRYYPFGETRYVWGSTPTDRRFTGQLELAGLGIYDYGARAYSPLLGRFISADSIVPRPGDPQSLNRYAYVRNAPLGRIDPTGHADGHADCADGDNACWVAQWQWQNRWYEAHGSFWDGDGWDRQDTPKFHDWDILQETLAEAGISFWNYAGAQWLETEIRLVAQGVIDLANKVGGLSRLHELLWFGPGYTQFVRSRLPLVPYPVTEIVLAHTFPPVGTAIIFTDALFNNSAEQVKATTVHELAHLIDYHYPYGSQRQRLATAVPKDFPVSNYAAENRLGLEFWAESVMVWVYPNAPRGLGPSPLDPDLEIWITQALAVNQGH